MRTKRNALLAGVTLLAALGLTLTTLRAATVAQIDAAIDNGLANLASTQTGGGYWNYSGYEQAATGAVVGAFMSQQALWGGNAAAYQAVVNNAMTYLLNTASVNSVSSADRHDGANPCPGGAASCTVIYWYGSGEATYTTGIVASAIGQYAASMPTSVATTTGPLAGMTWRDIAQGITNEFAAGQSSYPSSWTYGGWRYFPGSQDSDGSTTQWGVLSLIYDQSLGATTPSIVGTALKSWLAFDQASNGSGCYQGPSSFCENSDTGSLLIGHAFVGDGKSVPAVQNALAFLNATWPVGAYSTWYGNFGQPYAMWADYKALELQLGLNDNSTITNLRGCGPLDLGTVCNWWQDYNQWLVANQNPDGSWSGYAYWYGPLATAWDVSILGGTIVPPPTPTPEPATLALLGAALAGVGLLRRRNRTR